MNTLPMLLSRCSEILETWKEFEQREFDAKWASNTKADNYRSGGPVCVKSHLTAIMNILLISRDPSMNQLVIHYLL